MKVHELILNETRNVKFSAWIQDVGGEFGKLEKRPAILILPGGGYSFCSDREAEVVAAPYMKAGFQAFILRYSTGEHKDWPNPLNDYEQAMELILSKEDEWHVQTDKIAVLGFSAGGHLAACAATKGKHRPNAAILGYAALSQETADMCQPGMPSPINDVDKDTCPFFLFATRDDSIVPVQDTVDFEKALLDNGIMFESHIYAYGMHGFSTGESYLNPNKNCNRVSHWVQDSIEWLKDVFGTLQADGLGAPACSGKVSGDWDEMLSADCTMTHLRKQPVEVQQLLTEVIEVLDAIVAQKTGKGSNMTPFFKNIKLRDLMTMIGQPESAIEQIDAALQQRSNVR